MPQCSLGSCGETRLPRFAAGAGSFDSQVGPHPSRLWASAQAVLPAQEGHPTPTPLPSLHELNPHSFFEPQFTCHFLRAIFPDTLISFTLLFPLLAFHIFPSRHPSPLVLPDLRVYLFI